MSNGFITTADGTCIFYKDWGPKTAQPIVSHHGWPLSADDWTLINTWQHHAGKRMSCMRPIYVFDDGVVLGA